MIYKLLENKDLEKFNKEVNQMLEAGWELYGHPFAPVASFGEEGSFVGSFYAQAFTREGSLEELEQPETANLEEDSDDIPF